VTPPGGLRETYELPLDELPEVAALLKRGRQWAKTNQIPLAPRLAARVEDLDAVAGVIVRRAAAAPGNSNRDSTCATSGSGSTQNGRSGKLDAMQFLSVSEAALLSGLGERRIRQLALLERLPGRRTSAGWLLDAEGVHRWMANR